MSQSDYWLDIDGIKSESEDKNNKQQFQLMSWSWGAANSASSVEGTGLAKGKVSIQDFHFVINHSKMSARIFGDLCKGKHIPKCVLTCRESTGDNETKPYMVITFKECMISSYQTGGSSGSDSKPIDQITLCFNDVFVETKVQDNKGIISNGSEAGYNIKEGSAR
jgi:type VI secretion system secreted protein Hcp